MRPLRCLQNDGELCNFPQAGKAVNEDANLIRPEEISFTASLDK